MARPTKLTKQVKEAILLAVTSGAYLGMAANHAGISESTLHLWMARGERGESPFSEFSVSLKKAQADVRLRCLAQIMQAANDGTWQAAAWFLDRTDREHFGRQRIEITGAGDAPIAVAVEANAAVLDALDEKIALMRERSKRIIGAYGTSIPVEIEVEEQPSLGEILTTSAIPDRVAEVLDDTPISLPVTVEETTPPRVRHRQPAPIIRPRPRGLYGDTWRTTP